MDVEKMKKVTAISMSLRVLYVEDNEDSRNSTMNVFQNFFDSVDIAVDGLDGLEHFSKNSYDLIITDLNMPKMSGIEMITKIREENRDIQILVLSAHNDTEYFTDTIKSGIDGYILKPMLLTQFLEVLSKIVQSVKLKKENEEYKENLKTQVAHEISKREKSEMMLIQQSKMASMGEMIGNIAHQWRQPLNELSLLIQSFKTAYVRDMLSEEFIEKRVEKGLFLADKMSQTIEDFRNFYSPTKIKRDFCLIESINKSSSLFEGSFQSNGITFYLTADDQTQYQIYGHSDEFEQVFVNILSNAKDAIIKQNDEEKIIFVELIKNENSISIKICDNGDGVSLAIIDKIFEPYFTTKGEGEGTGIGLYMSKEIITKYLNGSIVAQNSKFEIDNNNYNGACFVIELRT